MNEQELRSLVERMVLELAGKEPVKTVPASHAPAEPSSGCLEDITQTDLRGQYLVQNPRNETAFRS